MWKSKKFIVLPILGAVLIAGATTGVVVAHNGNMGGAQAQAKQQAMLDRVAAIYEENTGTPLDKDQLKAALAQARAEMKDQALKDGLQKLVDSGSITQEQADALVAWWQIRPVDALSAISGRDLAVGLPFVLRLDETALNAILEKAVAVERITQEQADALKAWWEAKPEVTLPAPAAGKEFGGPMMGGKRMMGGKGMMSGRGFGGGMMGGGAYDGGGTGCPYTPEAPAATTGA